MTTKFVEVTLAHKYREVLPDGSISGGPNVLHRKWSQHEMVGNFIFCLPAINVSWYRKYATN